MQLQSNLLRFLQEGTIKRVGSIEVIDVNTRVIAATNIAGVALAIELLDEIKELREQNLDS